MEYLFNPKELVVWHMDFNPSPTLVVLRQIVFWDVGLQKTVPAYVVQNQDGTGEVFEVAEQALRPIQMRPR